MVVVVVWTPETVTMKGMVDIKASGLFSVAWRSKWFAKLVLFEFVFKLKHVGRKYVRNIFGVNHFSGKYDLAGSKFKIWPKL